MNLSVLQLKRLAVKLDGRHRAARRDTYELEGRRGPRYVDQPVASRRLLSLVQAQLEAGGRHALHWTRGYLEPQGKAVGDHDRCNCPGQAGLGRCYFGWPPLLFWFADCLSQQLSEQSADCFFLRNSPFPACLWAGPYNRTEAVAPVDQELARRDLPGRVRLRSTAREIIAEQALDPGILVAPDRLAQVAQEPRIDEPFPLAALEVGLELVDLVFHLPLSCGLRLSDGR